MTDVLVGRLFFRKYSEPIARRLAKTSVTPNQVTFASIMLSFLGSFFFLLGSWGFLIAGALVWTLSEVLDFVDGDLARAKKMTSAAGVLCDSIADTVRKPLLILSLSVGHFLFYNEPMALLLGLVVLINIYLIDVLKVHNEVAEESKTAMVELNGTVVGMLDTIILIVLFGALVNEMFLVLLLLAVVPIAIWVQRIVTGLRLVKKLKPK